VKKQIFVSFALNAYQAFDIIVFKIKRQPGNNLLMVIHPGCLATLWITSFI